MTTMARNPEEQKVMPVVQEELAIGRRVVETGAGVRVDKRVIEREEIVDQLLATDDVRVERVRVDRLVEGERIPATRYEGDTLIVPILEEVLLVEKRIVVKEELRITSARREHRDLRRVVLRSEEVSIEPLDDRPERA